MPTDTTDDLEPDLSAPDTLAALKDLVHSPGWKLLTAQARHEWGPEGYGIQMQQALANIGTGPDRAYELAAVAEKVDATARAVNALIAWPEEQIAKLGPKPKGRPFEALRRITR